MKYTRKTMHLGAQPSTFANARHLRENPTPAELLLWQHLRDRLMEGVKFRQQHPLLRYVVDFYAHEIKLVIEVDGEAHNESVEVINDRIKSDDINKNDFWLIRYTNDQVLNKTDVVLESIRKKVKELKERKERLRK